MADSYWAQVRHELWDLLPSLRWPSRPSPAAAAWLLAFGGALVFWVGVVALLVWSTP